MAFGLGALRLTPAAFWAMTLGELAAVVRGLAPADGAPKRERLADLMRAFPDR